MGAGVFGGTGSPDEITLTNSTGYVGIKTGMMQLVEKQTLTATATTISFTIAGDADEAYILICQIEGANTADIYLGFNGIGAAAGSSQLLTANNAVVGAGRAATPRMFAVANGAHLFYVTYIRAKTGTYRFWRTAGSYNDGGICNYDYNGWATDTATAWTSLELIAQAADTFGIGSTFYLFKTKIM